MNVTLHIERLVLEDVDVAPGQRHLLKAAVETELARLLAVAGLGSQLTGGGALRYVNSKPIRLRAGDGPALLGKQIARSVYGGIGK